MMAPTALDQTARTAAAARTKTGTRRVTRMTRRCSGWTSTSRSTLLRCGRPKRCVARLPCLPSRKCDELTTSKFPALHDAMVVARHSWHAVISPVRFAQRSCQELRIAAQGAKSQAEALRQFQMRVLSLLEIYLKKQPASALAPLCALPMLRALRSAVRPSGHAPLAKRLQHVLTHQLAATKPTLPADLHVGAAVPPGVEMDADEAGAEETDQAQGAALAGIMRKVMYFATREEAAEVRLAATKVYTCLLVALGRAAARGDSTPAAELFSAQCGACVEDVLAKRKSRWTAATLAELCGACKPAAPLMLQRAAPLAAAGRTEYARVEALQVCAACARHAAQDAAAFTALAIDTQLVAAVIATASGGFTQSTHWASALTSAAGLFESLLALHRSRLLQVLPSGAAAELKQAIAQGLSAGDVPARCATQLHRLKKAVTRAEAPPSAETGVKKQATGSTKDSNGLAGAVAPAQKAAKVPNGGTKRTGDEAARAQLKKRKAASEQ